MTNGRVEIITSAERRRCLSPAEKQQLVSLDVVGDGGMYSSVEDMLLWMKNFERPAVGAEALKLMQSEAILDNGKERATGWAWPPCNGADCAP